MKASKLTYLLAIAMALSFVATGCKPKPGKLTPLPKNGETPMRVPGPSGIARQGEQVEGVGTHPLPEDLRDLSKFNLDRAALAAHMVQFAYDSTAIRSSEKSKVDAVASFMKSAPANVALLIEGHCDERGTEEYNRSLGERRALAIREALIASGADGGRMTTRSYGKDRKIDTGNSEAAHAKNRRGEFVVLTPK